jgi:hypothetical protein
MISIKPAAKYPTQDVSPRRAKQISLIYLRISPMSREYKLFGYLKPDARNRFIDLHFFCRKDFGKYSIVQPGTVSSCRSVPENIVLPPYAHSMKPPTPPKEIEIHSNSSIASIKQACKLARQVLDWTSTKLEVKENKVFNLN